MAACTWPTTSTGKPWPEVFLKTLARNLRRMGPDFAPEELGKRRAE